MKDKSFALPNQSSWDGICRLRNAREKVKSWLTIAEEELKDARWEIDELGTRGEDSEEFKDAAARKERAERQRDALKERLKTLANKLDAAVDEATKGESKLFDDIDWKSLEAKPTAKELYGADDADDRQMEFASDKKKTIGKPGVQKPAAPDQSMGDGYNEHLKASVNELDMREDFKGKLIGLGYDTIGKAFRAIDNVNASDADDAKFSELLDLPPKQAGIVVTAIRAYVKKHNKAELQAEKEAVEGPSAGGLKLVGTAEKSKPGKGAGRK